MENLNITIPSSDLLSVMLFVLIGLATVGFIKLIDHLEGKEQ